MLEIGPNLSFWGTVNLDETTEPMSPRLLDRVHFINIGAEDIEKPEVHDEVKSQWPYAFSQLVVSRINNKEPDKEAMDLLNRTIEILIGEKENWGPPLKIFPRQEKDIVAYLAAAKPILNATAAADLAVNQRILPGLRGRGEKFHTRMKSLADFFEEKGLKRSMARMNRILEHAQDNYLTFDFNLY